jgi:hypothetical protein
MAKPDKRRVSLEELLVSRKKARCAFCEAAGMDRKNKSLESRGAVSESSPKAC